MNVTTPANWRIDGGVVPLSDVARTVKQQYGTTYAQVDQAVRADLIRVEHKAGRGNGRHLSLDEALMVLAVAALAVVAGITFRAMLRAVRSTGGRITAAGLTIPLAA